MSNHFILIGVKVGDKCAKEILKTLKKEEWYPFNSWYKKPVNGEMPEKVEGLSHIRNLYGENITIQAIVGKNGCGKSSLIELVYRMFNNLSYFLRAHLNSLELKKAEELRFVKGIDATLYFEYEESCIGKLVCSGDWCELSLKKEESFCWSIDGDDIDSHNRRIIENSDKIRQITESFCYCLGINYSSQSLQPMAYSHEKVKYACEGELITSDDYIIEGENWIEAIYNKNDGYYAALGLEPYKSENTIDFEKQEDLGKSRLMALLVKHRNCHPEDSYFDGYFLKEINLIDVSDEKISKHFSSMFNAKINELKKESLDKSFIAYVVKDKNSFAYYILDGYGVPRNFLDERRMESVKGKAVKYLIFKTINIILTYPRYNIFDNSKASTAITNFIKHLYHTGDFDRWGDYKKFGNHLKSICGNIAKDKSHVTLKIRQVLNFLSSEFIDNLSSMPTTYDSYIMELFPEKVGMTDLDEILEYLPIPLFSTEIFFYKNNSHEEKIKLSQLSSGESQFLLSTSAILYHLNNINSSYATPQENNQGKFAHYRNVTLILDEIELSFHPDYQRRLVKSLTDMINTQKLKSISINIILVTHSPFVLSDIPRENILYLEDGSPKNNNLMINPFGANVNDILKQSFFLKDGFMGEFAKREINEIIDKLRPEEDEVCESEMTEIFNVINLVGDEFLRKELLRLYFKKLHKHTKKDTIVKFIKNELEKI